MGYYEEKYTTLFKGYYMLYMKQRWDTRRLNVWLRRIDKLLKEAVVDIEGHKVSKALRTLKQIIKRFEKAIKKSYKIALDEMFYEDKFTSKLYKEEESFDKEFEKIVLEAKKKGDNELVKKLKELQILFFNTIFGAIKKAEIEEERPEYRFIEAIITASEKKDHRAFMQALKTAFKKVETSMLERFAARHDIKKKKRSLLQIKHDDKTLLQLLLEIENIVIGKTKHKTFEAKSKALKSLLDRAKELIINEGHHLQDFFYNAYVTIKRDILYMARIFFNIDYLLKILNVSKDKSYLPYKEVIEDTKKLMEEEDGIAAKFRIIAQGLRIIIAETRRIEVLLKKYYGEIESL